MKKIISVLATLIVFSVCCVFSITANANEPVSLENANIALSQEAYTYTGKEMKPSVEVTLGDVIVPEKYLTVAYANNVNAGTATVSITGNDLYQGTVTKNFKINPLSISSSAVSKTIKKTVVGSKPSITLKFNNKTLVKDKDYKVTYSKIDKVGERTGKVHLTGIGNFKSSKTYSINIYPKKVSGIKNVSRKETSIEFSWSSQKKYSVSGYKVYSCDAKGNNKKFIKKVSSTSAKITGLDKGKYYYYTVRAYKTGSSKIIYGDYSSVYKTCTVPKKVVISNVANTKDSKHIIAKWKKVPCSGYEIMYSTDSKFKKGVKKVTLKNSASTQLKFKASAKKTYYIKVRAFRKYGKVKVNGSWSSKLTNKYSNLYATYSSNYVNNKDRTTNLKIASKAISGTILKPGETFSFNKVVGKRTAAKGYKPAHVFSSSSSTELGLGGGVCQVASTMFNTTLLANLSIVERHQHSQRVSYVPLGRDAAIYWGSKDYRFKNNTKYPIKIVMTVKNGKITCSMYTSVNVKPKKVTLKVKRSGNNFTLKRYVGDKCNYTAKSRY